MWNDILHSAAMYNNKDDHDKDDHHEAYNHLAELLLCRSHFMIS